MPLNGPRTLLGVVQDRTPETDQARDLYGQRCAVRSSEVEVMSERLDEELNKAEEASQHMMFTFSPERFWEEKYREEAKERQLDAVKHLSALKILSMTCMIYGAIGFALGAWLI